MKKKIVTALAASALLAGNTFAAGAADVTDAIDGITADASAGVIAGVTIGAILFGARVVWRAVKSMAR